MNPKRKCNFKEFDSLISLYLTSDEKANVYGGGQHTVVLINNDPDPDPVYIPGDPDGGVVG